MKFYRRHRKGFFLEIHNRKEGWNITRKLEHVNLITKLLKTEKCKAYMEAWVYDIAIRLRKWEQDQVTLLVIYKAVQRVWMKVYVQRPTLFPAHLQLDLLSINRR